jgi:hypothetical protein
MIDALAVMVGIGIKHGFMMLCIKCNNNGAPKDADATYLLLGQSIRKTLRKYACLREVEDPSWCMCEFRFLHLRKETGCAGVSTHAWALTFVSAGQLLVKRMFNAWQFWNVVHHNTNVNSVRRTFAAGAANDNLAEIRWAARSPGALTQDVAIPNARQRSGPELRELRRPYWALASQSL